MLRVQSDRMLVEGFHQRLVIRWSLLCAPLFNGSSAFGILATGKCSRALKMLSTERFEGGMHRCSLHPAQRMQEINPRNVTKNTSLIMLGRSPLPFLLCKYVQVVGSPSYCKLMLNCNVLQRIATCF